MNVITETSRARLLAFYLPQFHPIPENDRWWGNGFTEWTNVAKAKPLFPGHWQPRLPADLGFYDLRVPETRVAQAELARQAGIEGFCYWHYWFGGKRLLERPFAEVVESGEPDFPFCVGWANESWSGIWHGTPNRILMEQTYPGLADHERHFYELLPAFLDRRYIRVNGKPLVLIYVPRKLPAPGKFIEQWQQLAAKNGLPGIHFVANIVGREVPGDRFLEGYDAVTICNVRAISSRSKYEIALAKLGEFADRPSSTPEFSRRLNALRRSFPERARTLMRRRRGQPVEVFDYAEAMLFFNERVRNLPKFQRHYPCLVPNWDNSPRSGNRAFILKDATPELFRSHLREALQLAERLPSDEKIIFVKSWNEWAEGNYLEPDQKFGHQYLDVLREEVMTAREPVLV